MVSVQLPVLIEGTLKHVEMVLLTKISKQTCSLLSSDIPAVSNTESTYFNQKSDESVHTIQIIEL